MINQFFYQLSNASMRAQTFSKIIEKCFNRVDGGDELPINMLNHLQINLVALQASLKKLENEIMIKQGLITQSDLEGLVNKEDFSL
jgi:hypothetical protein